MAGAGDQDRDGYDDVLVGAIGDDLAGVDAGAAFVFSGRTHRVLRRIDGGDPGGGFGSATDAAASLGGRRPDLIVGAWNEGPGDAAGGGGVHVLGRAGERFALAPPAGAAQFGNFFVAGVGRVDRDGVPDVYAADYAASGGNGFAGVYAGRDGSLIHGWPGGPGDGTGPGREAGDVDRDGRIDLAVGSYTAGPTGAGRVDVRSGRTGRVLRSITSTTAGENLGFDAVGVGDANRDGRIDLLLSAATGSAVYLVAGRASPLRQPGARDPRDLAGIELGHLGALCAGVEVDLRRVLGHRGGAERAGEVRADREQPVVAQEAGAAVDERRGRAVGHLVRARARVRRDADVAADRLDEAGEDRREPPTEHGERHGRRGVRVDDRPDLGPARVDERVQRQLARRRAAAAELPAGRADEADVVGLERVVGQRRRRHGDHARARPRRARRRCRRSRGRGARPGGAGSGRAPPGARGGGRRTSGQLLRGRVASRSATAAATGTSARAGHEPRERREVGRGDVDVRGPGAHRALDVQAVAAEPDPPRLEGQVADRGAHAHGTRSPARAPASRAVSSKVGASRPWR